MSINELIKALKEAPDWDAQVVISNIRNCPFAVCSIKEVKTSEIGNPVYIRVKRSDSD